MPHNSATPHACEFVLNSTEAILARTLALMTAMVQGCCHAHRQAIREKVIANLCELELRGEVSQQFRAFTSHLQQHWLAIDAHSTMPHVRDWHEQPDAVQ